MAVKILSRQYTNMFRPGDAVDPAIKENWLLGNVGVWQKLTIEAAFSVHINFTTTNPLFLDDPNVLTLTSGTWNDYGFAEGDAIVVEWLYQDTTGPSPVVTTNRIPSAGGFAYIGRIDVNKAYLVDSSGVDYTTLGSQYTNIMPATYANYKITDAVVYSTKRPQGIKFTYGQMENGNGTNLSSFIDGTLTEFLKEDTDTMTNAMGLLDMVSLGNQSGMSIASTKIRYLGPEGVAFNYRFEIIFMISSFFEDITNLELMVSPSQTFDAASLTDNFQLIGYPVMNNPNVQIKNELTSTEKLGNTGWFDENFNGLPNDFTLTSILYQDASFTTVLQLDHANPIKVTAVIDGVANASTGVFSFGFAWIPIEEDYKHNQYPFYKNLKMQTGGDAEGFNDFFPESVVLDPTLRSGYSNDSAQMDAKDIRFEATGATQITFECTFTPNAAFTTMMAAKDITERNYVLWVSMADITLITNKSNRVSILLDYSQMDTYIPPVGPYDGMTIDFLDHTQDEDSVALTCGNDFRIEDGILGRVFFQIDTATGPTIPIPTALSYGIIVERISDGLTYELDIFKIDLTQYPDPTQFNFDASRGFKLGAGNNKNFIKVDHWAALDSGTLKGVRGLYGFKLRWEDWIKRINVPAPIKQDFYNNAALQDGINNDWFQWLSNAGYTFSFVVYTDAILNGNNVVYKNTKPLTFVDYDDNSDITSVIRYYRDSDSTLLVGGTDPVYGGDLGVILNNELVRIEIDYTRATGSWSLVDIFGINSIEVDGGAGQMEYRQLSNIWLPEIDSPLLSMGAGNFLTVQLVSPAVLRCTCRVDPAKLITANRYKITGREGCK